jgi:hypothetical protein
VRIIQAVLIPNYILHLLAEKQVPIVLCLLCYVVGCVHNKIAKPDMSMEPKITCSKIFTFQLILELLVLGFIKL